MSNATVLRAGCVLAVVLGLAIAATASAQQVYVPPQPSVGVYVYAAYPYGYYNPRRTVRQAIRYGYVPAAPTVYVPYVPAAPTVYVPYVPAAPAVTRGPSDFLSSPAYRYPYYGSPVRSYPYYGSYGYYGTARPPIGNGGVLNGNGSAYQPGYGQTGRGAYHAGQSSTSPSASIPVPPAAQTPSAPSAKPSLPPGSALNPATPPVPAPPPVLETIPTPPSEMGP